MANDEGNVAKRKLSAAPAKAWDKDFCALSSDIKELQKSVEEISRTYLKKPWTPIRTEEVRPHSLYNEIQTNVKQISEFRLEDFYRKDSHSDEMKTRYFGNEKEGIKRVIDLASSISSLPAGDFVALPQSTLIQIRDSSYNLAASLHKMRDFCTKPKTGDHITDRDKLKKLEEERTVLAAPFSVNYRDFFDAVSFLKNGLNNRKIQELTELVANLTDEKTKEGIKEHHKLYSDRASKHFWASVGWLIAGFIMLAVTCVFANDTLQKVPQIDPNLNKYIILSTVSVRVFIFGLLTSVTFWSFRNYRLNKHNELLNRQKEMALKTFSEFANASGTDQEMRKIVIGKIAGTIFDAQPFGFLSKDNPSSENGGIMSLIEPLLKQNQ